MKIKKQSSGESRATRDPAMNEFKNKYDLEEKTALVRAERRKKFKKFCLKFIPFLLIYSCLS